MNAWLTASIVAALVLPNAAEALVTITEIERASAADIYYETIDGEFFNATDDNASFSGGFWTYDAAVFVSDENAEGEMHNDHTSDFLSNGFQVTNRSHGDTSFFLTVADQSACSVGRLYVYFSVDIETVFQISGTISASQNVQGFAFYGIQDDGAPFMSYADGELGQTVDEYGVLTVDDSGILPPGDYLFSAETSVEEHGETEVDLIITMEAMTVPTVSTSWSGIKKMFGN